MATIDLRLFIRATPERVWQVISDLPGQKRWMVDLREIRPLDGNWPAAEPSEGLTLNVTSELFGLPLVKDRMRITRWEPPNRFDVEHIGQFTGTGEFILQPMRGGSTVLVWREVFKPPLGPLGELGFRLVVGPHLRSVFRRSMENVRRLAEAS